METYIELGTLVYEHKHCKGIFAQSKLTPDAIRSIYSDFYELPDETRIGTFPNYSNEKIKALEKVKLDSLVPSQQTILLILKSEGTGIHSINQKPHLMSDTKELFPDWVAVLEGETVTCEDVTIKLSTSLPIPEGCSTVTCDKCQSENGKSISSIDTGRARMEHGAKTDSDLARPPGGDHPATQQASPGVLTQSAARRGRSAAKRAHSSSNDSE